MQDIYTGLIIFIVTCLFYANSKIPLAVTAVLSSLVMVLFGFIEIKDVFKGFSDDTVMLCIGMSIVGATLISTGVSDSAGKLLIKYFSKSRKSFLIVCIIAASVMSAFMSNVAAMAIFIPVIVSVAQNSEGKIMRKDSMMAVAIATGVGGLSTLAGSPPQMVAQAILKEHSLQTLKFFELAYVGVPLIITLVLFFSTAGWSLNRRVLNYEEKPVTVKSRSRTEAVKAKQILALSILAGCIAAFILQIYSIGYIAMFGAMLSIFTGCISFNDAFENVDWNSIFTIAGAIGFSQGLTACGVCEWIASGVVLLAGKNISGYLVFALLVLIAMIVTNFMSNVATTAILVPIGISIAHTLGLSAVSVVVGVVSGASLSFAAPTAAPPMTMALGPGGYKFSDYVKIGGLFTVSAYFIAIIIIPIFFPLYI